jgi:hypothetical protein
VVGGVGVGGALVVVMWWQFVVAGLACYRLTRLVTTDTIFTPVRELVADRPRLGYLVNCDWCVSVWVGLPVAWLVFGFGESVWVWVVLGWFGLSAVTGLLSLVEARLYPEEISEE